ncbi:sensor histidine kinase [Streptomyces sp. NPDC101733]|uniref:sensor histidine kinase n=1 Tax=unclassified Streptomyces TaxID=2593676 RepID=UPI0037FD577A
MDKATRATIPTARATTAPEPTTSTARTAGHRALLDWGGLVLYLLVQVLLGGVGPYAAGPTVAVVLLLALALIKGLAVRHPVRILALALLAALLQAFSIQDQGPYRFLVMLPVDLLLGFVVATRPRRVALPAGALVLAVQLPTVAALVHGPTDMITSVLVTALTFAAACMAGLLARERREHAVALRTTEVSEAVTAERLRIARELHDMVAHSIGVIAIQAGVGSRVIATQPEEARNALVAIEDTSREALSGLRRTLVALRRAQPDGDDGRAPTGPAPGLADLDALAESVTASGVPVEVRRTGGPLTLPPDIDLSAYRIVQEALTNVVRHAGEGVRAVVSVEFGPGQLTVEVLDDGRGTTARAGRTGFGLTGMYERVSLLHGRFSAGPRPGGGFRVAAELPLPEAGTEAGR